MIVIYLDQLQDFVSFFENRISDNIFYEIKEIPKENDLESAKRIQITLHFLGKMSDEYLVLYETNIEFQTLDMNKAEAIIIEEMQKILDTTDLNIKLIKGKIREIYISYS